MNMKGHEYCSRFQSQNLHHHHHHHRHQQQRPSAIFLPMLCSRPSIVRDVHGFPNPHKPPSKPDPLSPKISCIGQVKRKNKTVVFPKPPTTTTTTVKYAKLKKFFSSRNLVAGEAGHLAAEISVAELDPPLPVVKRRPMKAHEAESLWKRRSGGTHLQGLQLHHPKHHLQLTTV